MFVKAKKGSKCPKENNWREYIDDEIGADVPETAYYMNLINDGSLFVNGLNRLNSLNGSKSGQDDDVVNSANPPNPPLPKGGEGGFYSAIKKGGKQS